MPASECCPGQPKLSYKFFTHGSQFVFGHGGDQPGYVRTIHNQMKRWLQLVFLLLAAFPVSAITVREGSWRTVMAVRNPIH